MDWPSNLKAAPIRQWPGELTPNRVRSKFKASLGDTLQILNREIWELTENRTQRESLEMLIAIPAGSEMWRIDGRPRANATPEHPGVIVALDSRFGHLSYPCDTFTTWQDNLRAVALALEALRKVDRYGVTRHGQQYRGFLAIEQGRSGPAGFPTADEAIAFLADIVRDEWADGRVDTSRKNARALLRGAQRRSHPDAPGGNADVFQRVSLAEAKLRQEGVL